MRTCVLVSGGVDSSVLAADLLARGVEVHPLYVRCGFHWERAELHWLKRLLARLARPALRPLAVMDAPMAGLLAGHWGFSGKGVPGRRSADERVYLPGRNLILFSQAGVYCGLKKLPALATAVLKANPFPDATPRFRALMGRAVSRAVGREIRILAPYARLTKKQVLSRAPGFPLELTFSCLKPRGLSHCGACNKCAERERALAAA